MGIVSIRIASLKEYRKFKELVTKHTHLSPKFSLHTEDKWARLNKGNLSIVIEDGKWTTSAEWYWDGIKLKDWSLYHVTENKGMSNRVNCEYERLKN